MSRASLVFVALAACSKGESKPRDATAAAAAPAADAATAAAPAPDAAARPAAAAKRCRLHGDPLARACDAPWGSIAADAGGRLHVVVGDEVRRYRRLEGEGCEMEFEGAVAVPMIEPEGQVVGEGPLYMQSGGPHWEVTATGGRVFLHDYLRGIHEIVGDAVKPVCPELQGVRAIAVVGEQAYLARNRGERVALDGRCKVREAGLDPRPSSGLYAIDELLVGDTGDAVLYGADGKATATLGGDDAFAPGGLCSIMGVVRCGDDLCIADGNCKKLVRYRRDGGFLAEIDGGALFERMPQGLHHATAAPDGIYLLVGNQDGELCEDAVFLVATH